MKLGFRTKPDGEVLRTVGERTGEQIDMKLPGKRLFGKPRRFDRQATFRRARSGAYGVAFIALFLTIAAILFDVDFIQQVRRQLASDQYAQTQGRVTRSFFDRHGSSKTLNITIEVRYWVDSQMFLNSDWGYPLLSNRQFAEDAVARFPVDSMVPVYYDMANPADVVLERGLRAIDLHTMMFVIPLNLTVLTGWLLTWGAHIRSSRRTTKRQRHLKERERPWLQATSYATVLASFVLFFGSFLGVFYTGWFTDLHGSLNATLLTWGIILGLCILAFVVSWIYFLRRSAG